jgi:hypothetical protein
MTQRLHRMMIAALCLLAALGIAFALTQMRAIGAAHADASTLNNGDDHGR